ncbi:MULTISPECIES: hypothetical protein [unclassified Bradyrhizobium]|uniref:hypothetical protein n=1 Tax=unclassified Bradyrhizobium TaxID=2631580 RepID=UPI001FFB7074|nr:MULTISPECIES: hypothetical protein [unclassified Bradyrhizobium]MCK1709645.1 hypothetical protein [Bradyrhizobium sp. 143]MCK1731588.1 hypothetical protein [Bradyrhizobium sp. 142]
MRYLMTRTLLLTGAVIAQPTVTSTRIEAAEWTCRGSADAALSSLLRDDQAPEACSDHALVAPGQMFEMRSSGDRIATTVRLAGDPPPLLDPVAHAAPDPVQSSVGVPLSFNDPMYANVKNGTSGIILPPDASGTDLSIVENSGDSTVVCKGSCNLTRVRIRSREGVRCISGDINMSWVYIEATGVEGDHADGVQCYAPGSTGTVTVKNSTFKMAGVTTAGYFSSDGWRGSHVFENVLFDGGSFGLRIPADGGSSVSLKNVYFVRGSFRYRPFLFDVVKGLRINIAQWENVRWANWEGDRLVLGNPIPRPP